MRLINIIIIIMKKKAFDDFSFKAPQSEPSLPDLQSKEDVGSVKNVDLPKQIRYRHLQQSNKKITPIFDMAINDRIHRISEQLQENIKKRLQLEKKLNAVKSAQKNKQQRQVFMAYNNNTYKSVEEEEKDFVQMSKKTDLIDKLVKDKKPSFKNKQEVIEHNKQLLLDFEQPVLYSQKQKIIIPILQTMSTKPKPIPLYTLPDQIKIQTLLRKATFPELPKTNLQQLRKQVEKLFAVHSPHSDIHYLLMIVYFHLKKLMKVRKHFEEILNFNNFNPKAYWISAESEFQMQNYDLCLSLSEDCMKKVDEKYLPRFIYLKAKSYQQIGNFVNSVICFNQLLKIKPNISEYYLERGILYHRIGYYKEAKQDFVTFGIMKPNAQQFIKDKVLCQKNEYRKKEYIALLAKMF